MVSEPFQKQNTHAHTRARAHARGHTPLSKIPVWQEDFFLHPLLNGYILKIISIEYKLQETG